VLRISINSWPLFRGTVLAWGLILVFAAIIDFQSPGLGQGALEAASFALGMGLGMKVLSREARLSMGYFASLPLDPRTSRHCAFHAGVFWLFVTIVAVLVFQYSGPDEAIVRWLKHVGDPSAGPREGSPGAPDPGLGIGIPFPTLSRVTLPLFGYWLTIAILSNVGLLSWTRQKLLDLALFLPILVLVIVGVAVRQAYCEAGDWAFFVGTDLLTFAAAIWLARVSLDRIASSGTDVALKGVSW
jgi:hypothetical protein